MHRFSVRLADVAGTHDDDALTISGRGTDGVGRAGVESCPTGSDADTVVVPTWFADFLVDRATRKPSKHTMQAYR